MLSLFRKKRCKGPVKVEVTVGVFIDGKNVTEIVEVELPEGSTLRDLFLCLDENKKFPRGLFRGLMKDSSVTMLKNGLRLAIPDDLSQKLENGDKVTIISSVAGG